MEENIINEDSEISIKDLIKHFKDVKRLIRKKSITISIIIALSAAIGLTISLTTKPKYTASLSFAVEDDEKASGISNLASQFGFSLGGSSSGAFGGDNLFELFTSHYLIEKTLLSPITIDNQKTNLLNLYIKTYELDEKWKKSKFKEIRELNFPIDQKQETFSRPQDSIIKLIYGQILKKPLLTVSRRSKKLSIGDISFVSENEALSKYFVENLTQVTTQFYVDTKTKITRQNYETLKHQTDSIKAELDRAVSQRAFMADNLLNAVKPSAGIGLAKKQTDIQVSANAYIEMKKNLEMLKISLGRETPLIQIIDAPIFPLEKIRIGKIKGTAIGFTVGCFISFIYLIGLLIIEKLRSQIV
ncbi:MAG: Wzz/FepE/Etk N-terminal domain-containing protein [Bacteroidota bacterium]|nr:Wzz/FepE/Etk N-terminal domain-containing protein [Bacteroidota bacterium]